MLKDVLQAEGKWRKLGSSEEKRKSIGDDEYLGDAKNYFLPPFLPISLQTIELCKEIIILSCRVITYAAVTQITTMTVRRCPSCGAHPTPCHAPGEIREWFCRIILSGRRTTKRNMLLYTPQGEPRSWPCLRLQRSHLDPQQKNHLYAPSKSSLLLGH